MVICFVRGSGKPECKQTISSHLVYMAQNEPTHQAMRVI